MASPGPCMARRMTDPGQQPEQRPPRPRAHARYGRSHAARPSPPNGGRTPQSRERESVNPLPNNPRGAPTGSSSSTPKASPSHPALQGAPACSSTASASPDATTGPSPSSSETAPTTTPSGTTPRSGAPPDAGPPASPSSSRPPKRIAPSTRKRSSTAPTSRAASRNAGTTGDTAAARSGTEHPGSTTVGAPPTGCRRPWESVVSNQEHRIARLCERSGAGAAVVQDTKFDTQKILDPAIKGREYQQGPLHLTHLRAYILELWGHRCAYCGKATWESRARFEIDHVMPRSKGGPTNVGNLVWACRACNQAKADKNLDTFLAEDPERSTAVLRRAHRRKPLAAAGAMAWICQTLVKRLRSRGLTVRTTTGADTAHTRKQLGIQKTHADDAACCGTGRPVTQLRKTSTLRTVGHGRRKQIKSLPKTEYVRWRLKPQGERRRIPCPGHARHPNVVHGVQTGDLVKVFGTRGWVQGRAQVEAGRKRVTAKNAAHTAITSRQTRILRLAPRNGYAESN